VGGVLAIGSEWLRQMGERLFVCRRGGDDPDQPEVVVLRDEVDLDKVAAWERVHWSKVKQLARASPRWSRSAA
jgi:hypothetical protein